MRAFSSIFDSSLINCCLSRTIFLFYSGADGSRSVKTVMVDTTGTGKSFKTAGKVTTNGQAVRLTSLSYLSLTDR